MLWLFGTALGLVLVLAYTCLIAANRGSKQVATSKTMVVLGSGGHTAEMLMLLSNMNLAKHEPRCYVVAETDGMSAQKAIRQEQRLRGEQDRKYNVCTIPRSREVGQSYITSVWTTLVSLAAAVAMVYQEKPALLLVNGPGTCIPVCTAAFLFRLLGLMQTKIVYVESIARVRRLSLSGKILYLSRMADLVFVQWEELQQRFPRSVFAGSLY